MINQVQPIYVSFTVPQQQLPSIRRYMAGGHARRVARCPPASRAPATGVVTFVDNLVDVATGTIRLKATFPNDEGRLWPGQFANVTLTLASEPDAIVVPSAALQSGPQGAYVFVAKPDSTAENRPRDDRAHPGQRDDHRQGAAGGREGRHRRAAPAHARREDRDSYGRWPGRRRAGRWRAAGRGGWRTAGGG